MYGSRTGYGRRTKTHHPVQKAADPPPERRFPFEVTAYALILLMNILSYLFIGCSDWKSFPEPHNSRSFNHRDKK